MGSTLVHPKKPFFKPTNVSVHNFFQISLGKTKYRLLHEMGVKVIIAVQKLTRRILKKLSALNHRIILTFAILALI